MKTVQILEDHDIIQSTDWCRPLQIISMSGGHSDFYAFESQYTGQPENNPKWVRADQIFGPVWFDTAHTLADVNTYVLQYEFIRGEIPKSHWYGKTRREISEEYEEYLRITESKYGKYKGYTWYHIRHEYPEYFDWAIGRGIVKGHPEW